MVPCVSSRFDHMGWERKAREHERDVPKRCCGQGKRCLCFYPLSFVLILGSFSPIQGVARPCLLLDLMGSTCHVLKWHSSLALSFSGFPHLFTDFILKTSRLHIFMLLKVIN